MESIKSKILKSFIVFIMIFGMAITNEIHAAEVSEESVTGSQEAISHLQSDMTFSELAGDKDILCDQRGGHLGSSHDIESAYESDYKKPADEERYSEDGTEKDSEAPKATNGIEGIPLEEGAKADFDHQLGDTKTYVSESAAKYHKSSENICTPKQAYVLSYTNENTGSYYSRVQQAWWIVGNSKGNVGSNDLSETAIKYQDFVKKISTNPSNIENTGSYKTYTHNGVSVLFPEIKKELISRADTNKKVKVAFNKKTQKYVIGPFKINYEESSYNNVDFGKISGFNIYTDNSSSAVDTSKWRFIYTSKSRENDNSEYPHSGEEFYIELDYIEGATKLTKIDATYKFLISGGEYDTWTGNYDKNEWKLSERAYDTNVYNSDGTAKKDSDGNPVKTKRWEYTMTKNTKSNPAQQLTYARKASRWYETVTITLTSKNGEVEEKTGQLKIKKIALDANGNKMSSKQVRETVGENQYFKFKVSIKYDGEEEKTRLVSVKAGSNTVIDVKWKASQKAPTYKVEEVELSEDSKWKFVSIENNEGSFKENKTVKVTAKNQLKAEYEEANIVLTKQLSGKADSKEDFNFIIIIRDAKGNVVGEENATITVLQGQEAGNTYTSKTYKWLKGTEAYTYEIKEGEETEASKKYHPVISKSKGSLAEKNNKNLVEIPITNNEEAKKESKLVVTKKVVNKNEEVNTTDNFEFRVKVTGVKGFTNNTFEKTLYLKAGESSPEMSFVWADNKTAPKFSVQEILDESKYKVNDIKIRIMNDTNKKINNTAIDKNTKTASGDLVEDTTVETEFENKATNKTKHSGSIKVTKKVETPEKMSNDTLAEDLKNKFKIKVTVKGTFTYDGKEYSNQTATIDESLPKEDGSWSFEVKDIVWYGDEAPTYTVVEDETNMPEGWKFKEINFNGTVGKNNENEQGFTLVDKETMKVVVLNQMPYDDEYDLTYAMKGIVWVDGVLDAKNDLEKNDYYRKPNGVYDEGKDTLKDNVEVTVYKVIYDKSGKEVSREVASAYKDQNKNSLAFPIVTAADGEWVVPVMPQAAVSEEQLKQGYTADYDVEFVYDGETYTTADFLSYKISGSDKEKLSGTDKEKGTTYRNASKKEQSKYYRDSMAIEVSNNAKKISEVSGFTAMDADGNTTGTVTVDGKQVYVTYSSEDKGEGYPVHSTLNTTDADGRVFDTFKATATTSAGNLTYPFVPDDYDGTSLVSQDTTIDAKGMHTKYKFRAVYNHCLNINMGLVERKTVDIGLEKYLADAKVVVNQKMYQYKYESFNDLTETKTSSLAKTITFGEDENKMGTNNKLALYKSDYYYRKELYSNDKNLYSALTSFYGSENELQNQTEMDIYLKYDIVLANNSAENTVTINSIDDYFDSSLTLVKADESKYLRTITTKAGGEKEVNENTKVADASDYADKWQITQKDIHGSDKDNDGKNIRYNKMTASGLGIKLKSAETKVISLTFKINKADNDVAQRAIRLGQKCNVAEIASYSSTDGKVDRDSAPGNVNIAGFNEKKWYEDDTFAAPRITVQFKEETGNGDRTVAGTVWEDNRTATVGYNQKAGNGVKDSGEKEVAGLTTQLVEKVIVPSADGKSYTQYDYTWPTSENIASLNNSSLSSVASFNSETTTEKNGNYTFTNAPSGDFVVRFTYGDKDIQSADYSESRHYNGQDYKSSINKAILKSGDVLQADSYMDLDKTASAETINSAVDNEARRLEVVNLSREITYENANKLSAAMNEKVDNWDDYDLAKYSMYAETPKMDLNIDSSAYSGQGSNTKNEYKVTNVNFGLEERPLTKIYLDKQIEEIKLTTSDGKDIMDAKYDISYEGFNDETGDVKAKVELNKANSFGTENLQAFKRDDSTEHGFRYINVDSSILETTTITVKYRFTAINSGEVDRTGKLAQIEYAKDATEIPSAKVQLESNIANYSKKGKTLVNSTKVGEYLGTIYYYGEDKKLFDYDANGSNDEDSVVTSTIRQLVDYIDNDVTYSSAQNASANSSWSNITTGNLSDMTALGSSITDKDGIKYETDNRNNLAVSVDSTDTNKDINNAGFITKLKPHSADKDNCMSAINLTITQYVGAASDDLQIDNVAEILKYNNTVGRRDELTVPGNQEPAEALKAKSIAELIDPTKDESVGRTLKNERDTSATEVITLSPPFGAGLSIWRLQVIAVTAVGLIILAGGIVIIKKKVLK